MNNSIDDNINHFFEDNTEEHSTPYYFSTLYLIIRDVKTCLKYDPNKQIDTIINCDKYPGAQWPATMTIFSGIDLLGKFLSVNDSNYRNAVGNRFKGFIKRYFDECNNENDSEIIFALRNALDHSFNLYSSRHYKFSLINNERESLLLDKTINNEIYKQINVNSLYLNFRHACSKYQEEILDTNNIDLRNKFNRMYQKYGTTYQY